MHTNPLKQLTGHGQSIWFDFISRKLLETGELARMVEQDGIRGVTSNPSIFEKAISEGSEYKPEIDRLRKAKSGVTTFEVYEALAIRDIQAACDVMRPLYDETRGRDGYVSLEVTTHKGDDRASILTEAKHLWQAVGRKNVMIKVPSTEEGVAAFEELTANGVNVNMTLLFAVDAYAKVAAAYVSGLEQYARKGGDVSRVASVASFFVSRIDSTIDKTLESKLAGAKSATERFAIRSLMGKAAIANAKLAYAHYKTVFAGPRWEALSKLGAMTQRVLWASTGTKNKNYSDVLYVEELIGPETVNTAPPATIDAFRDHGRCRASLETDLDGAKDALKALAEQGIVFQSVTDALLADGLKQFNEAFAKILKAIESAKSPTAPLATLSWTLSDGLKQSFEAHLADWTAGKKVERLWKHDATLWTNGDEAKWLGWLDAPEQAKASARELTVFAAEIKAEGFTHVALLGMGGSSLCPEVLKLTYGSKPGFPKLEVLDSTDPQQIAALEKRLDLAKTLFVVASKSGSTLEPTIFEQYFWDRAVKTVGAANAGKHFVAITDPGSKLEASARSKGFRRIFAGVPSIGGRFSALSNFGMVPAALTGLDLERFTARACEMRDACKNADAAKNPGVVLGTLLGVAAKSGRDKLTFVVSPEFASLGAWLEQLIAESTGKLGKGIIPVDLEPIGAPSVYGNDRLFVYIRLANSPNGYQDSGVSALEKAGHAVVRIQVPDVMDLGAGFFRWEFATAVAGSVLGIHTFDQPDVEASKVATKALTSAYEASGSLPAEQPFFAEGGLELFTDARNAATLTKAAGANPTLSSVLRALVGETKAGDYFGVLAYVDMNAKHVELLNKARTEVRDTRRIATVLGFGPRFLHSTGQAYKGGPNSGVFLQITANDAADLQVPGSKYTFGVVKSAQARGDFQVLSERGRRCLRVHVTGDVGQGLAKLADALHQALAQPATAAR
ncbi:MAG: bifunctional transaldolase/phosoglucose isomerase [Planctomycetes bacterium]|nr:bifunctional transaldolase/phosoglucose isomerase [Planctomycetota bacterium]